jgi:hypothetical protein
MENIMYNIFFSVGEWAARGREKIKNKEEYTLKL